MVNHIQTSLIQFSTFILLITVLACTPKIHHELTESQRAKLIKEISEMDELDQKYRTAINLGTLDTSIINTAKKLGKEGDVPKYIAFTRTISRTITEPQIDSLEDLQNQIDLQNYQQLKTIIKKYGYPSAERLGVTEDKLYAILLHNPREVKPKEYLDEMVKLLTPEVVEKRMKPKAFASFYDNVTTRLLNQPQLYGTIKSFNAKTMSPGLPLIGNIEETNSARKKIGLAELKEGQYEVKK